MGLRVMGASGAATTQIAATRTTPNNNRVRMKSSRVSSVEVMISDPIGLGVASIQSGFVQRDEDQPGNAGSNAASIAVMKSGTRTGPWGDRRSQALLLCFF